MSWAEVVVPLGNFSMEDTVLGMPVKVKKQTQFRLASLEMELVIESKISVVHSCVIDTLALHTVTHLA